MTTCSTAKCPTGSPPTVPQTRWDVRPTPPRSAAPLDSGRLVAVPPPTEPPTTIEPPSDSTDGPQTLQDQLTGVLRDLWFIAGSRTAAVFFSQIDWRYHTNQITAEQARRMMERGLRVIVGAAMSRYGRYDRTLLDDLVQQLELRVAQINAASRFCPSTGVTPLAYLSGIAHTIVKEVLFRKPQPQTGHSERLERAPIHGNQLDAAARAERLRELEAVLQKLSPGEIRVLVDEFGPLPGCPSEVKDAAWAARRRRRWLKYPHAFDEAVALLRQLAEEAGLNDD